MGLDSFWEHPENKNMRLTFVPPLKLCGGMFSGNGAGSFRGKVYDPIVSSATGVSLYHERIDNDTVCEIADALERFKETPRPVDFEDEYEVIDDLDDLCRMFRAYANAGFELRGWW